jgi:hypothetical protein
VRLEEGKTAADLVAWASTLDGPPPGELVGGFGAIGPGLGGWLRFDGDLAPGNYVLACFIPGADGNLHVAAGMVAAVPAH